MNTKTRKAFKMSALAAALLAVLGPARAADEVDTVAELSKPESTVSVGAGYVFQDNQRFGQYTGMDEAGFYGLIDFNLINRNDSTGTWDRLDARNLGLDSRELRFEHSRQGNWGTFLEYNQIPRLSPYTINTPLQGIGTNVLTNGSTTRSDTQLSTERKITSFGLDKVVTSSFDVQLRVRHEEKDGTRLAGAELGSLMAFIAEPVNYKTDQLEATLSYTGDALQLSGGYYGSLFTNDDAFLVISPAPASAFISPAPLAPSNMAHQLFLTGGYSFTPTTRGTFKLAYTRATQDETFVFGVPTGTLLNSMTSPEARVDTTLAQVGLTARPLPKLSMLANLRYEDREDKTPELAYVTQAGTSGLRNTVFSRKTLDGKLEAGYQLPMSFRLTGGVGINNTERTIPDIRIVSWRGKNDETSYRLELRRSMSETLNGAVSAIHSVREGSDYLANYKGTTTYTTALAPIIWANRDRDKLRLALDWLPVEALSLQVIAEGGRDEYSGLIYGPRIGSYHFYSFDAAYTLSEKSKAHAWVSRSDTQLDQQSRVSNGTTVDASGSTVGLGGIWVAQLGSTGDSIGVGVSGKPTGKLGLGANVQYSNDRNSQDMSILDTGAALPALEEIYYRTTRLQLYGTYALQKNTSVRLDLIHERRSTNDWTWVGFVYPQDGTTVRQDTTPSATFVGASVHFKFQ